MRCRARTDAQHLEIALTNEGFPLTAVTWPDGSLDDFPAAADAKGFDAKLPVQAEMPIFADDITVRPSSQEISPSDLHAVPEMHGCARKFHQVTRMQYLKCTEVPGNCIK